MPFVAASIFALAFSIGLKQYIKSRYPFALLTMLGYFCGILWALSNGLYYLFQYYSPTFLWHIYMVMPIALLFFLLLTLDSISRDSVEPIKMIVFSAVSASTITLYVFRDLDPLIVGVYGFSYILLTLIPAFIWLYYTVRIYIKAPKDLRKYSTINLIGGVLIGILTPYAVVYGFNIFIVNIPALNMLLISVGLLLSAYAFAKEPKLSGILPFKVLKISVFHTQSGISLFSHTWMKKSTFMDVDVFSGMLIGINTILNETFKKGELQEIKLAEALLIIYRSEQYPVATVLVTTRSSHTLREGLKNFSEKFFSEFSLYFDKDVHMNTYNPAKQLITECFPFVPEYK